MGISREWLSKIKSLKDNKWYLSDHHGNPEITLEWDQESNTMILQHKKLI
jgi:hypothetical protein